MGSPWSAKIALGPSICSCDHDAFHIWGTWEILVTFFSYEDQSILFFSLKSYRGARQRDRQRDREAEREKRGFSGITFTKSSLHLHHPLNHTTAMMSWSPGPETYPSDRQDSLLSITPILSYWDSDICQAFMLNLCL